jgi:hypothetical protein
MPVNDWKHCNFNVSVSKLSMPADATGATCAAIACKPWNVDPNRKQSFVLNDGAAGDKFLLKIKLPERFTMKSVKYIFLLA